VTVYDKSPAPQFLLCNATHTETIVWVYETFDGLKKGPIKGETGITLNVRSHESGYYSCIASNKMMSISSGKVTVKVLTTSLAIPRVTIEMRVSKATDGGSGRRRRDISTSKLAKALNIKEEMIHKTEIDQNERVKVVFQAYNLSSSLAGNENWNEVAELVVKEREKILVVARRLDELAVNKSKTLIEIEGASYVIDRRSIQSVPMPGACKEGQILLDNGFVCGKLNQILLVTQSVKGRIRIILGLQNTVLGEACRV